MYKERFTTILTMVGFISMAIVGFILFLAVFVFPVTATTLQQNSGAIWTTRDDCGSEQQDVNHYAHGEKVYINGANFDPGVYSWTIKGLPGGASLDPGETVAGGNFTVDATGAFCFFAYRVNDDDGGEYQVKFGNKGDNYRVDRPTPTETAVVLTNTPVVPTNTEVVATGTIVAPTNTEVPTVQPTNTPQAPTNTPQAPTNTPQAPTNTPQAPTNTPQAPTNTPVVSTAVVPPTSTTIRPPEPSVLPTEPVATSVPSPVEPTVTNTPAEPPNSYPAPIPTDSPTPRTLPVTSEVNGINSTLIFFAIGLTSFGLAMLVFRRRRQP